MTGLKQKRKKERSILFKGVMALVDSDCSLLCTTPRLCVWLPAIPPDSGADLSGRSAKERAEPARALGAERASFCLN